MYRSKMRRLVGHVCLHFFGFILEFKQFLSVVGDVLIESEVSVVTFFNLNDMSAQEVGLHVCIHRNKCVCVYERLRLYCVSQKKYDGEINSGATVLHITSGCEIA